MLEAYSRNKVNGATGLIMWMLNNAFVSHMWNMYDFYGRAGGSFYGPARATQHLRNAPHFLQPIYANDDKSTYLLSGPQFAQQSDAGASFTLQATAYSANGTKLASTSTSVARSAIRADDSVKVGAIPEVDASQHGAFYLQLLLSVDAASDEAIERSETASTDVDRAVYWLSTADDVLDWDESNFYTTPVKSYANLTSLSENTCDLVGLDWSAQVRPTGMRDAGGCGCTVWEVALL